MTENFYKCHLCGISSEHTVVLETPITAHFKDLNLITDIATNDGVYCMDCLAADIVDIESERGEL